MRPPTADERRPVRLAHQWWPLLALLVASACAEPRVSPPVPAAGVLDLRSWRMQEGSTVHFEGAWEAWWGKLLDADALERTPPDGLVDFARPLEGQALADGTLLPRYGYGTFRLRVLLPERDDREDPWVLTLAGYRASELEVRDEEGRLLAPVMRVGRVGTSASTWRMANPQARERLVPGPHRELQLVLRTSCYNVRYAVRGWWVGALRTASTQPAATRSQDFLVVSGMSLMFGLYHLALFALRRREEPPLFFGLFCIAISARTFAYAGAIESRYPTLDLHDLRMVLEYGGFYLAVGLFPRYLRAVFPGACPLWLVRANLAIASAAALLAALLPMNGREWTLWFMERYTLLVAPALVVIMVRVFVKERDRTLASLMLAGTLLQCIAAAVDILSNQGIVDLPSLESYGIFAFTFFQGLMLAVGNSRARRGAERLAVELDAKNAELSRMDRLKDEFLATTSHELRTPLNGIIGIAESLHDGATGELSTATRSNLRMISGSGRRLASLVNDILDMAKLRHGELALQLRPVDLRSMGDVVLELSRPLIGGKPVELANRIPPGTPLVSADENRLQQVLHNLVGNAVKFTSQGSVVLEAEVRDDAVVVTVADTGIGVPPELRQSIFEAFVQGDGSTAREYGGTGLGLSITRKLVELQGGRIWIEDGATDAPSGSRFRFSLPREAAVPRSTEASAADRAEPPPTVARSVRPSPAAPPEPVAMTSAPEPTMPPGRLRVLAVDDDPVNLAVVTNQLSLEGYDVTCAGSGHEALSLIERQSFDAVVLDLMMPRMTGYEVCRRLRERHGAHVLPVLLLTAKNQEADLVEGFEAGANDYLVKPFSRRELASRLRTHVALAKKNAAYGRFVPHEFLRLLGKEDVMDVALGDQVHQEMTVLFADIRSFSTLSERLSAKETFGLLNECLARIGPVVRDCGGFIDKYIGDAVMALFPRSPDDAVGAAVRIVREAGKISTSGREGAMARGITIGVGIHTGLVTLGTIGEAARMEGTVISDAVNLASRLEGVTRVFGVSALVSDDTLGRLASPELYRPRFLGIIRVRGKRQQVLVFEVHDPEAPRSPDGDQARASFNQALVAFRRGDLARAGEGFRGLAARDPSDGPAAFYAAQCSRLLDDGVPDHWDGIIDL